VRFYSEEASAIIGGAFSSLIPGALTIFAFAGFKVITLRAGIPDIHQVIYEFLYMPFQGMGNTLPTAILYNLARHLLWFIGIHGSNALEPVMTEIYVNAMRANDWALVAGEPLPFIFTKTFFDSFISIGGAGGTLSLILAFAVRRGDNSMTRIGEISLLPAIFNINETLLFGLPIVLNPIFLVPFLLVPVIATITSYCAMLWGLVPIPIVEVAWTTPAFIGGCAATGSVSGGVLQLFNILVGVGVYLPFVRIAENVRRHKFNATYKALLEASGSLGDEAKASLVNRADDVGSISRALANDLLLSIKRGQLFLEYQPQVDCRTGRVIGVEALLRWMHPRIGRVPPSLFIPLAEEIGFIGEMGMWVCEESFRQLREWRNRGITDVVMSFNVSVKQLDDPALPRKIMDRVEKYKLAPGDLKAEVTESTGFSTDMGHNMIVQEIRKRGVKIAIDDFGMGHTSLIYLKKFPVTTIKLDGSLVKDVATDKVSAEIIYSIGELARSMKIELLAEFVETPEQAMILSELGSSVFQGYLYSPSLPPDECERAIRKGFPSRGELIK
jgi:EAL domain-containing protein (putative c-di-GMP-specific phosphodiesterase class I)